MVALLSVGALVWIGGGFLLFVVVWWIFWGVAKKKNIEKHVLLTSQD